MGLKQSNEITVKIKCDLNKFYKIIEEKGFKVSHKFSMDDTYFVPKALNLGKMKVREILSNAVIVREVIGKTSGKVSKKITVKFKEFDKNGNILSQSSINCEVVDILEAKNILKAMGYIDIMNIKENDIVYEKDGFEMAIKDIENADKLIEIETVLNSKFDTIDKLIQEIKCMEIPIYYDNYFVKKAEIQLEKVLKNKC